MAWFREREAPGRWDEMSADHGFNATPVWMILGSTLARLAPASDASIGALALLDPLFFLAMVAALLWGFGLRTAAVALAVLATSFPSRFFWTGGAYLRWDWLFFCVLALALGAIVSVARRAVFYPDAFAEHLAASLADPRVAEFVAERTASAVIRQQPDLTAFRPLIVATARGAASSSAFQALVRTAARTAHRGLFSEGGRTVIVSVLWSASMLRKLTLPGWA